jgi:predicted dehydrogenase
MALDPTRGLTVAVLGTGRMARLHLRALARLRDRGFSVNGQSWPLRLVLYGRDPAKVAALQREFGLDRTTTDLAAVLDAPDIDIVDNCLVNTLHYEPLLRAVRQGKHAFTDKPLANTLAEARDLLSAAQAAGVRHGIVQNMRFQAGPARAKELLEAGALGRVFHVRIVFGYFVPETVTNRPAWFYQKDLAGGGIVHDMMAHFFDLLRYWLGPIRSVYCATGLYFPIRRDPEGRPFVNECEDAAVVVVRFASGALGDIFLSWVRRKHEEVPFFEIDGEKASLIFSFNHLKIQSAEQTPTFTYDPTRQQADPEAGWESLPLLPVDPFEVQLRDFLTAVVTGQEYRPNWADAVETQHLIELAYESAASGRAVLVE